MPSAPSGRALRPHLNPRPQVAVYYFPNYHVDPRNEGIHGQGWTEWELVKAARPRWKGHRQPRIPAWGYTDEADPRAMAQKIAAAADHGVDAFIFDWYWYNDGSFLERALKAGYLGATNRQRVKFALMWANHDWTDIHPQKLTEVPRLLYPGRVTARTFDRMADHITETYFSQASYWKIDDRPYFSIYDLGALIAGLGGLPQTRRALQRLRKRAKQAGHPDLHLNLIIWNQEILAQTAAIKITPEVASYLGFDSITSYVWIHHVTMDSFPEMSYSQALTEQATVTREIAARFSGLPYYPNVTMGWDSSPRTLQTDGFCRGNYPYISAFSGGTPKAFRRALLSFRKYLEQQPANQRILTINAWNEWTEGSYLEPDTVHGLDYLRAIRSVFGTR